AAAERASRLAGRRLTAADLSALPSDLQAMATARLLRLDADGRVQVYLRPAAGFEEVEAAVRAAGGNVERSDAGANLVQAWLPAASLEGVAADPAVRFVRPPDYGSPQAGSVQSQGDAILKANLVRSTFGVDGTGVRVGVISDGVGGLASSQGSGDLATVDTATCNLAGGNPGSSGAEGTAMLEIVHDLAPGAQLFFGHFSTSLDFNATVTCLAANTDVVVDDISFVNTGPYDGTSPISANTSAQLANPGHRVRAYATAVANFARNHYEEQFLDSGDTFTVGSETVRLHRFQATAGTTDAGFGIACPSITSRICGDSLVLVPGGTVTVHLEWNDPFGTAADDYDLFLFDANSLTLLAASANPQTGSQDPTEALAFTNSSGSPRAVFIAIGKFSGAARKLNMFVVCGHGGGDCAPAPNGTAHNFNTLAGSVPNQADAGGNVLSVGAINAADAGHVHIEPFSSRGPTADGRLKPDITGIDGVSVTGAGGFENPFFGTSAASPHVAAILALMLQIRPDLKAGGGADAANARNTLRQALVGSAVDLGAAGPDDTFGAGRVDALAAANTLASATAPCVPDANTLCIDDQPSDRRFKVKVSFHTVQAGGRSGLGNAIQLSSLGVDHGGIFWFFDANNPEMLIKVINACALNNKHWVFYSAGTNVGLTTTVTDTMTGLSRVYTNNDLTPAPPIQDGAAFSCALGDGSAAADESVAPGATAGETAQATVAPKTAQTFTFPVTAVGHTSTILCLFTCFPPNCTGSGTLTLDHALSAPFSATNFRRHSGPINSGADCTGPAVSFPVTLASGQELIEDFVFAPTQPGMFTDTQTVSGLDTIFKGNTPPAPCTPDATTLCINNRFKIQVHFNTTQAGGQSGMGQAIPLSSLGVTQGGLFWFFGADNPEMLVKVINACALNNHFWVFYAAGTNVGLTTTVTDTVTGHSKMYMNLDLHAAPPVQDTGALPCS
ncbi:MAG TPA: S8 family serine peptidase, partial [Thermoanaerobaculia bacterium]|nr:S8 family serine peptidase [Thermoanaerobaculia bacterium]